MALVRLDGDRYMIVDLFRSTGRDDYVKVTIGTGHEVDGSDAAIVDTERMEEIERADITPETFQRLEPSLTRRRAELLASRILMVPAGR